MADINGRSMEGPALCAVPTSVVDIGWHLDVAHLRADWQLIEVFVFFQGKLSPQRQCISIRVHLVDQHGIIVLELRSNHETGRMMTGLQTLRSDGKRQWVQLFWDTQSHTSSVSLYS